MKNYHLGLSIFFVSLAMAGSNAHADSVSRPLAAPNQGQVKIDLNLEISLADGAFFAPAALAPDIYYGVSDSVTVGLVHSAISQGLLGVGGALRLGDDKLYNTTGLEGYLRFLNTGTLELSGQGGLYADAYSPDFLTSIKLGAIGRLRTGQLEAVINPQIRLPLNESEVRENQVHIPVLIYYGLREDLDFAIVTGLQDEAFQLGFGAAYDLVGPVDLGGHVGWPRLVGNGSALDALALNLYASIAL
tara:strand:+ start:138 stop:875 length:738 start_codon:yes stop_codon:yes gene_type:complete